MNELLHDVFGQGRDLNIWQMAARAFVMFFITLILIRITGMRAFGAHTAFDNAIVIMLGALLSRAVVGISPFLPTVAAGLVLALVHRILAFVAVFVPFISHMIKGREGSVYKNGVINENELRRSNISHGDLMEAVRLQGGVRTLDEIEEAYVERNGQISVIRKK